MKQKYSIIFLAVLSAVVSCVQVDEAVLGGDQEQREMISLSVSATIEKDLQTKTSLEGSLSDDSMRTVWAPSDKIGLVAIRPAMSMDEPVVEFVTDITENTEVADFEGTIAFASEYHAFYPYQSILRDSCGVFIFNLPQEQKYVANSFDPTAAPMVAKTHYGEGMDFQNLCGLLAIQIKGEETVKSITFIGKDQFGTMMPVSGQFEVNMYYENEPSIVSGSAQRSVTLKCDTPVTLSQDVATPFYFVLPPATYSSFFVMIQTADGKVMFREGTNPLTVSRSHIKPTAALKYAESIYIDLSEIGWSNCYIVPQAGLYSFDATVIGNGEYGFVPEIKFHTDNAKIDPKSVELLWTDKDDLLTGLTIKDGEVRFFSTGVEGNAVVAVKDDSGKILWSWHIWVTDQPQEQVYVNNYGTFTMLDRNNGAIRADAGEGEEWREAVGVKYQWGRKDPFTARGMYGGWYLYTTLNSRISVSESIESPSVFAGTGYNGWESTDDPNLWNAYQKTIYDPCPVGYRMPTNAVWRGFTTDGQDVYGSSDTYNVNGGFNNGWNFYYDDVNTAFYPAADNIDTGGGYDVSSPYCYMWSAFHSSQYEANAFEYYYYSDSSSEIHFNSNYNKVNGFSVRCMKDEGHIDTSYPSVAVRNVVDVTSESATVIAEVFDEGISEVTERGIVWGLNENLTVESGTKVVSDVAGGGEYSIVLSGLDNATVYYVRPYAINSKGTSYGKVSSFRTTYAGEANNLSAYGTSNCYIVDPAYCKHYINGSVKGSGYESIGSVESVEVLWETNGYGMKTDPGTVIFDVTLKDGNIYFYTNGVEGNALVASKDAMGTILWSWHIWVTDAPAEQLYNGCYWVLDRNIGAVSAEEGTGEQWKLSCGLPFQRGRKDPFVSGTFTETYAYYSMEDAIAHPTVYDNGWNYNNNTWSWSDKTIYDPCPVGYRVAVNNVWGGISRIGTDNGHGVYFYFDNDPSTRYWYPFEAHHYTDYISYKSSGRLATVDDGYYWSADNNFNNSESYAQVRCMKDEGYVDMSYPIVKMNVTTDISSTGATINAEITNTGIAEITSRGFIWSTSADLTPENGTRVECGAGSGKFTKTLEGLAHSTRYYVMAYATNDRGTSYSNVTSFFTPYEGSAVNLSRNGTANCYIVPVAYSEYAFNASVKGNSNEPVGNVAEAVVLWESRNDRNPINVGDVVTSVTFDGNMVHFYLPTEPVSGNAVIAVKDVLGTILWSWHIWVVDFDPVATQQTYISGAVMMDRNLGALNVIPGDLGSFGLMYQWGRKDPFMGSGVTWNDGWMRAYTAPSDAIRYEYYDSSNDTIENAVKNPTVVYNDARWNEANDLWGYKKTMYDPCPAGWRVSDYAAWEGLVKSSDSHREYIEYPEPYSTPAAYFPTAGYTSGEECINHINHGSYLWLTEHRRYVDMWHDRNPYMDWRDVDYLNSVRCMKDDPDKNGDNEDYTEGDDYEWND